MAKYRTYNYHIINPEKYMIPDTHSIILRSSWEVEFAKHTDLLPNILQWGYELVKIPYHDPLTGKQKLYIPDFFVRILLSDGSTRDHVFEIKPMHEQLSSHARNSADAALVARNKSKWIAAVHWADRHNAEFAVINESDLFKYSDNKKGRMYPVKQYTHTNPGVTQKLKANTTAIKKIVHKNKSAYKSNITRTGKTRSILSAVKNRRSKTIGKVKSI